MPWSRTTEEEFRYFFEQNIDHLIKYANSIIHDFQDAEDIAVESLARSYASWRRISGSGHREAWVFRTVLNLSIDHLRRHKRRRTNLGFDESIEAIPVALKLPFFDITGDLGTNRLEIVRALPSTSPTT